jgi:thymidylate kinase
MQATLPEGMRMFHFASLQALMVVDAYTYAGALSAASGPRSQQWAVTDRWFVSGLVYTRANKLIERLTPELQAAYDRLPRPDLTVFCTVPDAVLDERLRARDKDVYEADPDMQTRVRAAYNDQIARAPLAKLVVDTTLPVERCLDTIFQRLVRMI